jgi:outer membrane protein OmpA-like peptidoglycan-associated protein
MKNTIITILLITFSLNLHAQQAKLKRANRYFDQLAYAFALDIYQKVEKKNSSDAQVIGNMAFCYFQLNDMTNAERCYAQLDKQSLLTKEQMFYLAQALKQNGKYLESDVVLKKINSSNSPVDLRYKSLAQDPNYLSNINNQPAYFSISNMGVNSSSSDFGACETVNGKEVFFLSARNNSSAIGRIWSWNKKNFLDLFSFSNAKINKQHPIGKRINSKFHEGPLCFSTDGKWVYFTQNNLKRGKKGEDSKGVRNLSLCRAQVSKNGKWKNVESLGINNVEYSVAHPSISSDGKTLYFSSDMPGGFGGSDIYSLELGENGFIGQVKNLGPQINTEGNEMFPFISSDQKLFFSSNGLVGLGGLDVFVVSVEANSSAKPMNLGRPINSQKDDFSFYLSKDNRKGYLSSNRDGGMGDDDIYSIEMIKPIVLKTFATGKVIAAENGQQLNGVKILLKDANGQVIASTTSDENGYYSFEIDPNNNYVIETESNEFNKQSKSNVGVKIEAGQQVNNLDFVMVKKPDYKLVCYVTDSKKHLPVKDVKLTIIDVNTGKNLNLVDSTKNSMFKTYLENYQLNQKLNLTILIEKNGYFKKNVTFSTVLSENNTINLHESIDIELDKIEVGVDLATVIDIKPIFFDLGKWNIRKDASIELDKIVKLMNEYPTMRIELGSHTDCRSSYAFNEKLSTNRAVASADYIKARIKNPSRIYGKGYGEKKLKINCPCEGKVVSTCSEAEHQANRRTEFIIVKF